MDASWYNKRLIAQLLSLIRSSLWQQPIDETCFAGNAVDWDALRDMAFRQTVGMLLCDAVLNHALTDDWRPSKDWIRSSFAYMERNKHTHRLVNDVLAETVSVLQKAGVTPVLLKGQAYARYYPEPILRQCGDVDLYVGSQSYARACNAAIAAGWECEGSSEAPGKHFVCSLRGVSVEIHRRVLSLPSADANNRFSNWCQSQLRPAHRIIDVNSSSVSLPAPIFDVVYVFLHLYHHFLIGGVGLRQLCDWVMILRVYAGQIDQDLLKNLLQDFGVMRAWQMFSPIAVDDLGLPESQCPFYTAAYRPKADKVLATIMREGNFGKFDPAMTSRPDGYFSGKLHSFLSSNRRACKILSLDAPNVVRNYMHYIATGLCQVFKDTIG